MIEEPDTVVLAHDLTEHGLTGGDVGVVVHVYADDAAYEVEFVTEEGTTVAVVTLEKEAVRSMGQREILHVRNMAAQPVLVASDQPLKHLLVRQAKFCSANSQRVNQKKTMPKTSSPVPFDLGDAVCVRDGVKDPDNPEWDITGWQGRVVEIRTEDPPTVLVKWDSLTLENMPDDIIQQCEKEGLDWSRSYFYASDLEKTSLRDTRQDVKRVQRKLENQYMWMTLGSQDEIIDQILSGVDQDNTMAVFHAWYLYLSEMLTFPFEAEIAEFQERSPFRQGDEMRVEEIIELDDHYGLIAKGRWGKKRCSFPLADLEARDADSSNYQPLQAYRVWFANR